MQWESANTCDLGSLQRSKKSISEQGTTKALSLEFTIHC